MLGYNTEAVCERRKTKYAAIAQPVERILGKDEVASSNLASSSKPLILLENQGFFLFCAVSQTASFFSRFYWKDAVYKCVQKSTFLNSIAM